MLYDIELYNKGLHTMLYLRGISISEYMGYKNNPIYSTTLVRYY